MKNLLITTLIIIFSINCMIGQKMEDVEIVRFESPYDNISVRVDGAVFEYKVNIKTKFSSNKTSNVSTRYFLPNSFVDLTYKIENRERIAKKVKLKSDFTPGKEKIKGVFEYFEGDKAYIDGRKVVLDMSSTIKCSKKKECGCTKGMTYLGFNELRIGDYLTVSGNSDDSGNILANKIELCENNYSDNDKLLRENVESSINANGMLSVKPPSGIVVPPNSLHKGNIKIGIVEYKLYNNVMLQGYVNVIGNKVIPEYAKEKEYKDRHNVFFRFYVIDNKIPNAYAFPNGMVFIHSGLLKLMENEAQLAIVLGHEIAHVTYEHASERLEKDDYLNSDLAKSGSKKILKNIFGSKSDGSLKGDILETAGDAVIATKPSDLSNLFNKDLESQADRVGLFYAFHAGYDIREASAFWQIMLNKTKDAGYQNNLVKNVTNIFLSINLEVKGKTVSTMAQESADHIIKSFLNTIYTSHPSCKKRLRDINDIINTIYINEELNLNKGTEAFKKRKPR